MKHNTQFLTAKFKLRPSKRKAALLEYVNQQYDDAFWDSMSRTSQVEIDRISNIETKKNRQTAIASLYHQRNLQRYDLSVGVIDGLSRDLTASVSSYVELRIGVPDTQWPTKTVAPDIMYEHGLDALASSLTKEEEDDARDEIYRGGQLRNLRPITLVRGRDCQLRRKSANEPIVAVISLQAIKDSHSRQAIIHAGVDAVSGASVKSAKSKRMIIIPVEMSKWHEHKFCNGLGNVKLVSSLIECENNQWYLIAQFEMTIDMSVYNIKSFKDYSRVNHIIGIDRGCCITAVGAVMDTSGAVKYVDAPRGGDIKETMRSYDKANRQHQRRKGTPRKGHYDAVDNILHDITNFYVAIAKQYNAAIAIENLDNFKTIITNKRTKGNRRNQWQKTLKTMQLRKLEELLNYKLRMAGLPQVIKVPAGGTSITCSACGHSDKKSRTNRETFECTDCGTILHADFNAAVQIGRRGVMNVRRLIKKGVKLNDLHKNMVSDLRDQNDGGLGPLVAGVANGLVVTLDSGQNVYEEAGLPPTLASDRVKKLVDTHQNQHTTCGIRRAGESYYDAETMVYNVG